MFEVFVERCNQFVRVLRTWNADYAQDKVRRLENQGHVVTTEYKGVAK